MTVIKIDDARKRKEKLTISEEIQDLEAKILQCEIRLSNLRNAKRELELDIVLEKIAKREEYLEKYGRAAVRPHDPSSVMGSPAYHHAKNKFEEAIEKKKKKK